MAETFNADEYGARYGFEWGVQVRMLHDVDGRPSPTMCYWDEAVGDFTPITETEHGIRRAEFHADEQGLIARVEARGYDIDTGRNQIGHDIDSRRRLNGVVMRGPDEKTGVISYLLYDEAEWLACVLEINVGRQYGA